MSSPRPISVSLSPDGRALALEPDFGAFALRPAQLVAVGVFVIATMAVAEALGRSVTTVDRWVAWVLAGVLCGAALLIIIQLARLWPGRVVARRARLRFERAVAAREPEPVLHARAVDLAFAASLPKRGSFAFDFPAWRNALADAGLAPVAAIFLGDAPPAFLHAVDDPGPVEPEEFTDHANLFAGQPGCLVWAAAIGGCAALAAAMTSGRWVAFVGPMAAGVLALLALLARRRFRPVQTSAVYAAPGRMAWSRGRASADVSRAEAVVVIQPSTGTLVVTLHHAGPPAPPLFFRGPGDERFRRFIQLWLAPRDPSPRIFETEDRL